MRSKLIRLAFATAAALSGNASAALIDCKPPQDATYLVFLSEPQFTPRAFPDHNAMLRFFNRLHQHLDERHDREMAGLESVDFRVARCENRVPAIDGADYTDDVVRNLYGRKVVVEIWGELDRKLDANSRRQPTAQMNYLLVPIRRGVIKGSDKVPGVLRFDYPDRQIVATDFVDLVSNADLHAFVASAIGVSAFDNNDFRLAHQMLCRASAQLKRTAERLAAVPTTKVQGDRIRDLHGFLVALARESVIGGRNVAPPLEFAILQEPANPCPGP
jgi:hypothetical protein